jgi:hypothetical protein
MEFNTNTAIASGIPSPDYDLADMINPVAYTYPIAASVRGHSPFMSVGSDNGNIELTGKQINLTAESITINGMDMTGLVNSSGLVPAPSPLKQAKESDVRCLISTTLLQTTGLNSFNDKIDITEAGQMGAKQKDIESYMNGLEQGLTLMLQHMYKIRQKEEIERETELE